MKKHNVYKDIVFLAAGGIITALLVWAGMFWIQQQKSYDLTIQSQAELTEEAVKQLAKIEGLYQFIPSLTCNVTLRLDEYTMETSLTGVEFEQYPIKWKSAQEEIVLGNSPVLFFGQEAFESFADDNGNAPGRSRISDWVENYQELELAVTDERGRERRGRIGGVLKSPSSGIYMSQSQMREVYAGASKTMGGCASVQGYRNMQQAREILRGAGFQVE